MTKINRVDMFTIIAIGLLAFGLQIPWLGFFQDDWNFVFYSSVRGTQGLLEFLVVDGRPGATWVYALGFALLGYETALWQFFALLLRVSTTIAFWMILNSLWPRRRYGNIIASIFFLMYPFFTLQPLSVAYAPHWMAYLLYALSIFFMIQAVQRPEKYLWFSIPAIFCTIIHLFTVEYFVGLEILRPLIIWFVLSRREKLSFLKTLQKTLITWFPYLLILVFFIIWRTFVLAKIASRIDPLSILLESGQVILSVARNMVADWVLMFIDSWFNLIDPKLFVIGPIRNFYFLAITLVGALCFYFLSKPANHGDDEGIELKEILLAGALIFAAGMISAYSVGHIVHLKIAPWNGRFALASMPGLALMSSGLIEALITSKKTKQIFLAVVVGLLIGWHNHNTLNFKSAWEKQERFYEQLIWRAPSIKPGTAIIANEEILGYMGDYPTSFGINTMYEAKEVINVPLWFFAFSGNYDAAANQAASGNELETQRATVTFRGNKQDAMLISYEPENQQCLWVLRPQDSDYKYLPEKMKEAVQFSNYENAQPQEMEHSLYHKIVSENKDTWCYFYQKADLARQLGDSDGVIALWQEAQSRGYGPANGFEYIAFIEAYARLGKWEDAFLLTKTANRATKAMYFILCPTWKRLGQETIPSTEKNEFIIKAYDILRCAPE